MDNCNNLTENYTPRKKHEGSIRRRKIISNTAKLNVFDSTMMFQKFTNSFIS